VVLTQFEELVDIILPKSLLHDDGVALGRSIHARMGVEFERTYLFSKRVANVDDGTHRDKMSRNSRPALLGVLALNSSSTVAARGPTGRSRRHRSRCGRATPPPPRTTGWRR